jgi:thioredoxin reductase (NADPH)
MGKVAVVGAGPAGMAATIQLVRAGHEVQVFEKGRVGGALWNARWVDNYPGFPGGISGAELANNMEKQFLGYIDNIIVNEVEEIKKTDAGFSIMGVDFDGVILCTGTRPKKAGFIGEDELVAAGLLHYGIAEVNDWRGVKEVAVIGGGEASMDMALNLAKAGILVTLIFRSEPRAIKTLMVEALSEKNISWHEGNVIEGRVERKAILKTEITELVFDRVIVAVGREARMPKLVGFDLVNPPGGVLVAGDAARGSLGQAAMAVGDGVQMAMMTADYLEAKT